MTLWLLAVTPTFRPCGHEVQDHPRARPGLAAAGRSLDGQVRAVQPRHEVVRGLRRLAGPLRRSAPSGCPDTCGGRRVSRSRAARNGPSSASRQPRRPARCAAGSPSAPSSRRRAPARATWGARSAQPRLKRRTISPRWSSTIDVVELPAADRVHATVVPDLVLLGREAVAIGALHLVHGADELQHGQRLPLLPALLVRASAAGGSSASSRASPHGGATPAAGPAASGRAAAGFHWPRPPAGPPAARSASHAPPPAALTAPPTARQP